MLSHLNKAAEIACDHLKLVYKFSCALIDLFNDWRNGNHLVVDLVDSSKSEEKKLAIKTMTNAVACWYFLINFFWVIRRWLALQINLERKEKIVLTVNRLTRLGLICYDKVFKTC